MAKITYIEHDGTQHEIDAVVGNSVMQAAIDNGVPGIDADCGGQCACATCHVYVDDAWRASTGEPSADEDAMLSLNPERRDASRLSCQIRVSDELNGLIVTLPEFQF